MSNKNHITDEGIEAIGDVLVEKMNLAYNTAIDHAIEVVRQDYLEDSPLWNIVIDKRIDKLKALKK